MKTHEQFDKLAEQCYVKTGSVQTDHFDYVKFAELIVRECMELNRKQSWDLTGVIIDVEESTGFDEVCMNTVKRVKNYLAGDDLLKHFGVEE